MKATSLKSQARPLTCRTSFVPETPDRNVTKAIGFNQNRRKINEADQFPAAHNGLAVGSTSLAHN
jgi:hypothetical protein